MKSDVTLPSCHDVRFTAESANWFRNLRICDIVLYCESLTPEIGHFPCGDVSTLYTLSSFPVEGSLQWLMAFCGIILWQARQVRLIAGNLHFWVQGPFGTSQHTKL